MSKSLITENRALRATVQRLQKENASLRQQCSENCHDDLVEQLRLKYNIPKWLLSERSYEVLATKDFAGIEEYMAERSRMMRGNAPKLVSEEAKV